ncbi:MAG: NUDIX hydrolase [Pseudorhodoplanes sp.]|nr:NUDIX hydrolase [Pseudorhodoplanes sp.]
MLAPPDFPVRRVARLELTFAPSEWPFERERAAEIAAHFARLRVEKPSIWDGRVLLLHRHALEDDTFRGAYLETAFASFIAWRDWGCPDVGVRNCFALAALQGSDGAFLMGVMSGHTANAGQVYFPGGTPDLNDVVDGRVDLERSIHRELAEETGLQVDDLDIAADWRAVLAGPRIAMLKIMRARETAEILREKILANIASQAEPELSDIRIVRGPQDAHPHMPEFVRAFLASVWR